MLLWNFTEVFLTAVFCDLYQNEVHTITQPEESLPFLAYVQTWVSQCPAV